LRETIGRGAEAGERHAVRDHREAARRHAERAMVVGQGQIAGHDPVVGALAGGDGAVDQPLPERTARALAGHRADVNRADAGGAQRPQERQLGGREAEEEQDIGTRRGGQRLQNRPGVE
jgi:hypothetical protein